MGNKENEKVMWYEVYRELAKLLVKVNPQEFYQKCMNDDKFKEKHNWTKVLVDKEHWKADTQTDIKDWSNNHNREGKREFKVLSFDPIQIFMSFNGFGMSDATRIEKINLYFDLLDSKIEYKNIDFTGCPTPMMIFIISMRHPTEVEKIWVYFRAVIEKGQGADIDLSIFDTDYWGVSRNFFTIFLFWIDSENFLPIDKNTEALFEANNQKLPKLPKLDWNKYIKFLKEKNKENDREIYQVIARMSLNSTCELADYKEQLKEFGIIKCLNKSLKIIAIKPLKGCNKKFLKGLKEEQLYLFDKAYSIDEDGRIEYDKKNDIQLFNQSDLQVNINAIVGRNGTGKSTLIELLLAVIHNIGNTSKKSNCKEFNRIDSLNVELIFEDLNIYKVILDDDKIQLFEYDNEWKEIKKFINKKQFFYNILVNYSIHSLDSSENSWIEAHFDNKCSTDIMIEPFRENGNINIQEEEKRVKERLIVNLLEPEIEEDEYSFRQLTEIQKANKLVSQNKKAHGRTKDKFRIFLDKTQLYDIVNGERHYSIELLSEKIENSEYEKELIAETISNLKYEKKSIEEIIPNKYFTDIILDNDIKFSQLSSGEKQKIYSINSILYHIKKLDRKKKHKHINLILDEIELYFHPELQRTYISDIIKAIKKVGTENILGINITFITHSPFILSDIPKSKILFLEKDSDGLTVPKDIDGNTFGANIHTLLSGSFFMENGLMGEFAKGKINEIKKFYEKVIKENKTDENIEFYNKHRKKFWQIQEIIGEPFLQKIVKNQLEEIELILLGRDEAIDNEIARLQALKKSSKNA